jgi:tRNA pseudouridine55 synthase
MSLKRYTATARFGISTSTQDASGTVVARRPANLAVSDLEAALSRFRGTIEQVPPMVSAVKVRGERLYAKARRGLEVERPARRVTITRCALLEYRAGDIPEAVIDVVCSAGTYVRTLVADIGSALGCGAHVASLRRTWAGGFSDGDCVALADADRRHLRPAAEAVRFLDRVEIDDESSVARARRGALVDASAVRRIEASRPPGEVVALVHREHLIGVYRARGTVLVPECVLGS